MAFGLAGLVLSWRSGERARLLVLGFLAMLVPLVLFFVTARYRVVLVPIVAVFAGRAFQHLLIRWRLRKQRRLSPLLASLTIMVVIVHIPVATTEGSTSDALYHYSLGVRDLRLGHIQAATGSFQSALRRDPRHVPSLANLAACYFQLGDVQHCLRALRTLQEIDPHNMRVLPLAAMAQERAGSLEESASTLLRLVGMQSDNWWARNQLGRVYQKLGRTTDADSCWLGVLQDAPDGPWRAEAEAFLADRR